MIPARIFQTWKSKTDLPENFSVWSQTFRRYNPSFEHQIWDDADNRAFIRDNFPWFLPLYDRYPAEIFRADVVRYFYLYWHGGIYADMDVECLRPLDGLLAMSDVVLGRMGGDPQFPHSIPNAIMASEPGHEFWLLAIGLLPYFAHYYGSKVEFATGPVFLKSVVDLYLADDPLWAQAVIASVAEMLSDSRKPRPARTRITLLPSREWYALDWSDPIHDRLRLDVLGGSLLDEATKHKLFANASMVTYWSHSW